MTIEPSRGLLLGLLMILIASRVDARPTIQVAPEGSGIPDAVTDLLRAVADAPDSAVITLSPGTYTLSPTPYTEELCGNCEAESTLVHATVGLRVSGRELTLRGEPGGEAIIVTGSGYGILFEDCAGCTLSAVTVTGGERDTMPEATDAAIVVKRSSVVIEDCVIRDNIGDPEVVTATVVGIGGIVGREGSLITAKRNHIVRNSWDGIAIYRDAQAVIEGNLIDGVDLARGKRIGGGRGVGIGVSWNAFVSIRGNLVRRYWKGIGAFVDAQVTVEDNIVEHVATWGINLWDAGVGRPSGNFMRNGIYDTGACGASIVRGSNDPPNPGRFVQNVLIRTGQDPRYDWGEPYCDQVPIAQHAVAERFAVGGNLFHDNRVQADRSAREDMDDETFFLRLKFVTDRWRNWPLLLQSDLWADVVEKGASAPAEPDSSAVPDSTGAPADSSESADSGP